MLARTQTLSCPDADGFFELARQRSGQDDFGDAALRAPLEAFTQSLRNEVWAGLIDHARAQAIDFTTHHLAMRARIVADRMRYSAITREEIRRPLVVVGPPRSGSTLLHTLLNLDPDNGAPEHGICLEPSPPPALGASDAARLDRAQSRMMSLYDLIPDIFIAHPYIIEEGSGALAECGSDIMNMAQTSQQLWCFYRGDGYLDYLLEGDHHAALGFHRNFLQHVQWGADQKRWTLKGSDHLLWLSELAATYPDALLIWTHRDLAQQLGSLASVQATLTGITGNPATGAERFEVGRQAIELQRREFSKGIRSRERIGEDRFVDTSYHELMANPEETVAMIYERAGLELSDAHRAPRCEHGWPRTTR